MSMFGLSKVGHRAAGCVRVPAGLPAHGGWMRREEAIMGTAVSVDLWGDDRAAAEAAIDAVMGEMHRIDRCMSPFKPDSELSRINREAAAHPVPVGEEMFGLLARSLEFSRCSDGAFDITYAGAGHLYDYRQRVRPTDEALVQACAAVGYRHLELDAGARTVRFAREGLRIDLGGFAKGHAVDNAAAILARRGIRHAFVSAGGDSRVIGDRRGRPWTIGVRDPRRPGEIVALLPLEDVAVSTSGDYERYFDAADGVRCHHILDPKTGKSPDGVRSVTIIAPDGLTSEGLSKCLFVMGVERGMRLVDSHAGVDAVVVDAAGALHYSCGLLADGAQPRQ
ncbi:FAD:protein FMN transferase [Methylibium sp.]|uniref:FAD:protein FMN transferase n=1 Tax=Methylibium sp. TaxID=2067992 RepID=UPI003D0A0D90